MNYDLMKTILIICLGMLLCSMLWIVRLYTRSKEDPEQHFINETKYRKDLVETVMMTYDLAKNIKVCEDKDLRNVVTRNNITSFEIVRDNDWIRCYFDWRKNKVIVQDYSSIETRTVQTLTLKIKRGVIDLQKLYAFFSCEQSFTEEILDKVMDTSQTHRSTILEKYDGSQEKLLLSGVLPRMIQKLNANNPDDLVLLTMFLSAFNLEQEVETTEKNEQ